MPNDIRETSAEASPLVFSWGMPGVDVQQPPMETATLWLAGGVLLGLWTGLALLLTAG
jgi:hypothetical protein